MEVIDMSTKEVSIEEAKEIAQKLYRYDKIADFRISSPREFNSDCIAKYKEQGYMIIDQLLNEAEIREGQHEINEIIHLRLKGPKVQLVKREEEINTPEEREWATRKIFDFVNDAPALRSISFHPQLIKIVEQLLGDKPKLVGEQGLLKPPFGGGEKPWHQDMAYGGLFYKKEIITAWIALDEAGLGNGCMHIIPRSHRDGGVPHYSIRDWQICDSNVNVEKDVAAPMKPGGVLLFSGLMQHGTPANFSDKRRRAVQLRFAPQSSDLMSKDAYKLMFTNEITDAEC
jgi:phytanoyl-CoA hydroxylase